MSDTYPKTMAPIAAPTKNIACVKGPIQASSQTQSIFKKSFMKYVQYWNLV